MLQVHPWLLKRAFVEDVGYFDAAFSPHQYEDDDLYIRMIRGGWKSAAVRVSGPTWRGVRRGAAGDGWLAARLQTTAALPHLPGPIAPCPCLPPFRACSRRGWSTAAA